MRRIPPQNKGDKLNSVRLHQARVRDDKRLPRADIAPCDSERTGMEGSEDVYEFKSGKDASPDTGDKKEPPADCNSPTRQESPVEQGGKRNFAEVGEGADEGDEENKRKKRKDSDSSKENARNGGGTSGRFGGGRNGASEKCTKVTGNQKNGGGAAAKNAANGSDRRSPSSGTGSNSPKLASATASTCSGGGSAGGKGTESDGEGEESRGGKGGGSGPEPPGPNPAAWTGGPKVPPLKIVIPQQSASLEQEQGNRNGKNGAARHHQALPYVVASSDANTDKEPPASGGGPSPSEPTGAGSGGGGAAKSDEKKDSGAGPLMSEEQRSTHHQRVLRSSHRSGGGTSASANVAATTAAVSSSSSLSTASASVSGSSAPSPAASGASSGGAVDRGSNNSSPSQSQSPSLAECAAPPASVETSSVAGAAKSASPANTSMAPTPEEKVVEPAEQPGQQPQPAPPQPPPVDLHPRKRKMKQSKESQAAAASTSTAEPSDSASTTTEVHPHDQPITNCYQLFLNIRKQIERRRKGLFPVQPKPPQGFKDYLMNRCTYVLAGNASSRLSVPVVSPPQNLQGAMKDLFGEQEKERYRLRMQHVIEKEKLVLSVEQEILRVHGRAARALANQSLPFSVCTILKDEEVYNVITPEQEEKDRNARSRYNGRLFLSWLQDVDDKWEKIKESMLLRHHNEAESLHAVQRMDWEWKMKELGICEFKAKPVIEDLHVPMVHVSDDFDLLPA
ncbi:ankyrin repeat domain-containing protein 11 isoform X2 [Periplaneta americana]|uniref:ankyrin repeat domain-containing protein 11 isoform X2 n=1 Tax=Periplaneta americana TaxID=6978 RepID=UPI0037E72681